VTHPWWRDAVVYQIYPRSFADGSGDGVGDLDGIRRHLDHVRDLGADAIWLSPIYPSPMADNGYDVSDYCDIDPVFGDLATFDAMLTEAHDRDIKVLLDWVPNHTSSRHPWFLASRSSRDDPKRDWYYWRDGDPDTPPNNWLAAFGGIAWTWDEPTEQWYLHTFLPEQPDLNWNNPQVRDAMHATLRFWLDRGVDGFRMDVVHLIGKDPALPDAPPAEAHTNRVGFHDFAGTHELLRGIRAVLDSYPGERVAVGEVNLRDTSRIATYYGRSDGDGGDELPLVFNFNSLSAGWDATAWATHIAKVAQELGPDKWPTWVLSNHDVRRVRTRLGGNERRARAMAVLLLTLRGTPFLYAGDELGLLDAVVPKDVARDPGGRDGCRAPIPWTPEAPHGWSGEPPWLPFPPDPEQLNVATEAADPGSVLALHRRLLTARRGSAALRRGTLDLLDAPAGVLAFERACGDDRRTVVVNFLDRPVPMPFADHVVDVASDGSGIGAPYDGTVGAETAVVLRPTLGA
jgi:alpha-glucosidase